MSDRRPNEWMWSEALDMLSRAERLHRQFFSPSQVSHQTVWEPPADVIETDCEVLIFVALPGVSPERVEVSIEEAHLRLSGTRVLPAALARAAIHRLELPQGRFERRIPIPPGHYTNISRSAADGCIVINLTKADHRG